MINIDASLVVTILYVILLYIFLSKFFFGPLTNILEKRHGLIEGQLESARQRMEVVERRTFEYEEAIRTTRSNAYRKQEQDRERAVAEKAQLIAEAKLQTEKAAEEGRVKLIAQAENSRRNLESEVDTLAKKLSTSILSD